MRDSKASGTGLKVLLIPAFALLFMAGLAAEPKSTDRLSELMKLSTLDILFDRASDQLKAGMRQALRDSPLSGAYKDKVLIVLDPAADKAFAAERLKREFRLTLDGKLTKADLDRVLAFHKSALGARIAALTAANQTPDAQTKITNMAGDLLERLKNEPERAEVLAVMDRSLRLTEFATDGALHLGRAIAIGMAAADEKTTVLPSEAIGAIDSAIEKMRPTITAQAKARILLMLAYTYREASVEELRQYLEFAASPAGKRYQEAVLPALNKVLVKAGEEFGHTLMRELGKEHA
jgi:hypothetical protein